MGSKLSVIGLGRMGSALATTLLKNDNDVTVWNRTESKVGPLVAAGASRAGSAADAVAASGITIVCVGNYDDSKEILSDSGDLAGKTLIQLTTGTAAEADALQEWTTGKGGLYLDGVIVAYPSGIGSDETLLIVAGSETAWEVSEQFIKCLGGASMYVGTALSAPIALESAMVGPSLMAIMGMIQGAYLLEQAGLDVGSYAEMLAGVTPLLTESLRRQANAIATNNFTDTEAALRTWAAGLNHNADAYGEQAGIDLIKPIRELLNRAVDAGYGEEEIAAAIKIFREAGSELRKEIPMLFPAGHFYSPIVDPIEVAEQDIWHRRNDLIGIDWNTKKQLALLDQLKLHVKHINFVNEQPEENAAAYYYQNGQFPCLDAEFLFTAICHFQPRKMIEVGCGFSSFVAAEINRRQLIDEFTFICIEPYPRQFLVDGVDGIDELIVSKIQDVDVHLIESLEPGDIFFVDTSHVSKAGSDVNHIFFELIPRLKPGVLVHIHDIFLPDEYPKVWVVEEGRNWNEQYIVHSFLQFNRSFEVVWMSHYMFTRYRAEVLEVFPNSQSLGNGGSLWFKRTESRTQKSRVLFMRWKNTFKRKFWN